MGAVLLTTSLLVGACDERAAGPRMVIADTEFDWGRVLRGAAVTHAFVVRNEGDSPLRIEKVVSPCSCAVVEHDRELTAGAEGRIRVSVDTRTLMGAVDKRFLVVSNDPVEKARRVIVRGVSVPYYEMEPARPVLEGFRDEKVEQSLRIRAAGSERFALSLPAERPAGLDLALSEIGEGREYELRVGAQILLVGKATSLEFDLAATFPDGTVLSIRVPLKAKAIERVVSEPKSKVVFSKAETGSLNAAGDHRLAKSIHLRGARPEIEFRVESVELSGEASDVFSVRYEPVESDKLYRVDVELTKKCAASLAKATLVVRVAEPEPRDMRYDLFALFGT